MGVRGETKGEPETVDWTYCRIFRVPHGKIPTGVPARVLVAYKPLEAVGADPLNDVYGWTRMVAWLPDDIDQADVTAHVNISSNDLYEVVKPRLQGFLGDTVSIYLIDYARAEGAATVGAAADDAFETRPGTEPWKDSKIDPPFVLAAEDVKLRAKTGKGPASGNAPRKRE